MSVNLEFLFFPLALGDRILVLIAPFPGHFLSLTFHSSLSSVARKTDRGWPDFTDYPGVGVLFRRLYCTFCCRL